jgi:hypothetical protein
VDGGGEHFLRVVVHGLLGVDWGIAQEHPACHRERYRPTHQPIEISLHRPSPVCPRFAAKLTYSDEVAALGYSEKDAAAFGIGFHRGHVYKAARYQSGQTAGFWKLVDGKWTAPKSWMPGVTTNVVHLRRT